MDVKGSCVGFLSDGVLCKLHDGRHESRAICTMPSDRWQQMRGAENVQVTKRQQLGAVLGKAALHLLRLLANKQSQSKHKYEHIY